MQSTVLSRPIAATSELGWQPRSEIWPTLLQAASQIVEAPPNRDCLEWAEANRLLRTGPEPGPWRTERVPYLRPIAAALKQTGVETVVVVMGSQMAKSELIINHLGQGYHDGPLMPSIMVQPSETLARSFSRQRVREMIDNSPLTDLLERGNRDKVTEQFLSGVRLGFAWAGSAIELSSHPAGRIYVDEVDRCPRDVAGEGDPVTLAIARASNFVRRQVLLTSTPTLEDSLRIQIFCNDGSREMWEWQCPHCRDWHRPLSAHLSWPAKADPDTARAQAHYHCPHCAAEIPEKARRHLNTTGRFRPYVHLESGDYAPDEAPEAPGVIRSFWVSGIASPWRTFGQVAMELARAYRSKSQETLQAVLNTRCGELYRLRGDAPQWQAVLERRRPYVRRTIPHGCQILTAGVDVQDDRLVYVIRGWGHAAESWLIDADELWGDTSFDDVWLQLSRVLTMRIQSTPITRMFIDSGFNPGAQRKLPIHPVYQFARRHPGHAFPVKGHATSDRPIRANDIDVTIGGRTIKHAVRLWHINSDYFKTLLYSWIRWPETAETGGWWIYQEATEEYARQVVAEELVIYPSGRRVWVSRRSRPNHYLDAEYMAAAAAHSLKVETLPALDPEAPTAAPATPAAGRGRPGTQRFYRRTESGFHRRN